MRSHFINLCLNRNTFIGNDWLPGYTSFHHELQFGCHSEKPQSTQPLFTTIYILKNFIGENENRNDYVLGYIIGSFQTLPDPRYYSLQ